MKYILLVLLGLILVGAAFSDHEPTPFPILGQWHTQSISLTTHARSVHMEIQYDGQRWTRMRCEEGVDLPEGWIFSCFTPPELFRDQYNLYKEVRFIAVNPIGQTQKLDGEMFKVTYFTQWGYEQPAFPARVTFLDVR